MENQRVGRISTTLMNARKYMQQMFYSSIIIMPYSLSDKKIQPQKWKKDIPGSTWRGFCSIMECTTNSRLVMPLIHPDVFTGWHGPKSSCRIRRSCMNKRQYYKMHQAGKIEMVGASSLGLHSKKDINCILTTKPCTCYKVCTIYRENTVPHPALVTWRSNET